MLRDGTPVLTAEMRAIIDGIDALANEHAALPMLSRTHGQTASPTTLGKEMANVAVRLRRQLKAVETIKPLGKFNGAVGNFNAHLVVPRCRLGNCVSRIRGVPGLEWNPMTTQIEPRLYGRAVSGNITLQYTILIDFDRDIWSYISLGTSSKDRFG